MIDPGRLKTRLALQAPVDIDDGQGGVTRSYTTIATVWAAILPLQAQRADEADADGAVVQLRIILREGLALTLRHRFLDGAKIYRIVALREIDDGRFVEISAEWRID